MIGLLRTRRWMGFTALVIIAIIGFGLLSRWQWARAEEHRQERLTIEGGQILTGTQDDISGLAEFSRVEIEGVYKPGTTTLVRQRPLDGGNGYWVLTQLQPSGSAPPIWVIRGWLGASTQARDVPGIPTPPPGNVSVEGAVRLFEPPRADVAGLPPRVVSRTSVEELSFAGQSQDRIVQLTGSESQDSVISLPLPSVDEGQNISYAVQWILFALVAMGGWFIFLRREAREDQELHDSTVAAN